MATWEDGPEYAPVLRPSAFDEPAVGPLPFAPPVQQMAALAPKARPLFADPSVPVAPLTTLVPPVIDVRDPQQPFAVVSSALTSDSGWGGVHRSPTAGRPADTASTTMPWGPPTGAPVGGAASWPPPPEQPITAYGAPPPAGGFPAPGTPAWFGPGPYGEQRTPSRVNAKSVLDAATPGLVICLVVGGLIYVLAPVMVGIAIGLSNRVKAARPAVHRLFLAAGGLLALVAVVDALLNEGGFGDWWGVVGVWALVISWVSLVVTLVLVHRGLTTGNQSPPSYRPPWG